MEKRELDLILNKSLDELYTDLVDLDEKSPLRSSNTSMKELVKAGRLRFEEIKDDIIDIICTSTFFEKVNSDTNEKELILLVADGLIGTYGNTGMPILTISAVVVKIGLTRLCRNRLSNI